MVERLRNVKKGVGSGGDYFTSRTKTVKFIPSGCILLDCVLGGGWARGRVSNIVGDKAVGKTLCAIEACANFAVTEPKGRIFYREAEAAFDEDYAESLGLPLKRVDFGPEGIGTIWDTIEDIFEDLSRCLDECVKAKVPGFYIIDSLDALSSRAELARKPGEATYGLEKQKMLGTLFRQLVRRIKAADFCILIISQVRDNIGVAFGEKHKRSGGKALDFYASQVLWLSNKGNITQTIRGTKRTTGVRIKAKCKKNKISLPFRECEFDLIFGYGTADAESAMEWLESIGAAKLMLKDMKPNAWWAWVDSLSGKELKEFREQLRDVVVMKWDDVERDFAPKRKKYG